MRNLTTARIVSCCAVTAFALTARGETDGVEEAGEPIEVGLFSGDEGYAVTYLWQAVLEDHGYQMNITEADHGPVFQGVSTGDLDLTLDVWLPVTHAAYLDEYGDSVEEIGEWYDEAQLTIAVSSGAPLDSLTELNDHADYFGNELLGIEPGAGLTAAIEDEVIPAYGLTDIEFKVSSTPAMLAGLSSADSDGDPVAVTLWRPHWAYDAFDIKDLDDPEGALGATESLYIYGSDTFRDDYPEVAGWLEEFGMDADLLHSLEHAMFNENTDNEDLEPIVRDWIEDNSEYVESLTS